MAISWLWSPLAGFSGLGRIWERHLQNIGTPFEHWLSELDELSRHHARPESFLLAAGEKPESVIEKLVAGDKNKATRQGRVTKVLSEIQVS